MCNHSSYICWFCCSNRFQGSFPSHKRQKKTKPLTNTASPWTPVGSGDSQDTWRNRHIDWTCHGCCCSETGDWMAAFAVQKTVRKTPRVVGIEPSTLHHDILENNLKSQANHQTIVSDNLFFFSKLDIEKTSLQNSRFFSPIFTDPSSQLNLL